MFGRLGYCDCGRLCYSPTGSLRYCVAGQLCFCLSGSLGYCDTGGLVSRIVIHSRREQMREPKRFDIINYESYDQELCRRSPNFELSEQGKTVKENDGDIAGNGDDKQLANLILRSVPTRKNNAELVRGFAAKHYCSAFENAYEGKRDTKLFVF